MNWIKDVLVDIAAFFTIVIYALTKHEYLEIGLWVYTGLIVIAKVAAYFMPFVQNRAQKTTSPDLFFHIIYALSIAGLFYAQNLLMMGTWIFIWGLSIFTKQKSESKVSK